MSPFQIRDSGERMQFTGGMVRDTTEGKIDYARVVDGPMVRRWAEHLTKGADKYPDLKAGHPNWMLADGEEEYIRFKQSAFRHFLQWYWDERDEDHAAAVFFNINGAEYVKNHLQEKELNHALERLDFAVGRDSDKFETGVEGGRGVEEPSHNYNPWRSSNKSSDRRIRTSSYKG